MLNIDTQVKVVNGCQPSDLPEAVLTSTQPLVLKGLVSKWPAVKATKPVDYVRQFCQPNPVNAMLGEPKIKGRFFYNDDMSGFNFERKRLVLDDVLDRLLVQIGLQQANTIPAAIYVGSTSVEQCLPGFKAHNDLDFGQIEPLTSAWIGNQTCVAAHYDVPDNIACVVAGKRRFTLFPPHQLVNLYAGPIDFTPAGQSISLVDFAQPDFSRYPKFADALQHAQMAELEPGDALFIPSMWWHHVEALDSFNLLINYWWRKTPPFMGAPMDALRHGLLSIRGLPPEQRKAWAGIFNHYVFNPDDDALAHIPEQKHGDLAPTDELAARQLRAQLLNKLNR
jgi:hypothetical protein